ncbi:hypothetical protein BO70DRAFT_70977 [Aspergillus heteromorphus CBS 117.55]|uniref:Uncharacterized protein n=1 Tax=Aspergillus heteromorphus CBS 117.55 TaxID=1448321 RepID=A0A317VVW3_9EURO|nr:uncharacterized protein BO70DRAFT_70977 [Aspergillus heteromorphus CBS 117.55]PWY77038.1 hypothetical protein BO70DRAFT_70977 [Aspergillus heteromorphus CBS 117.55]
MSLPKHTSPEPLPLSSSPSKHSIRRTSGSTLPSRPQSIIDRPATAQQVTLPEEEGEEQHLQHQHHNNHPDTQPPFQPFFTLIEDAHSSEYHHPTIHYIFSDDDTDIITEAALRTLESEPDGFPRNKSQPQPHAHHDSNSRPGTAYEDPDPDADADDPHRKESLLPHPIPGVRDNYIILDVDYASQEGAAAATGGTTHPEPTTTTTDKTHDPHAPNTTNHNSNPKTRAPTRTPQNSRSHPHTASPPLGKCYTRTLVPLRHSRTRIHLLAGLQGGAGETDKQRTGASCSRSRGRRVCR